MEYYCVESPKVAITKISALTVEEVEILLKAPSVFRTRDDAIYRDTLFILVGYMMGLRRDEAFSLTFDDILHPSGFVDIIGKGAKNRTLPVPEIIRETAKEYRKIRGGHRVYKERYTYRGNYHRRTKNCFEADPKWLFISISSVHYGNQMGRG